MNITCLRDQFYKAVSLAERNTSKDAHLPFLQGILIYTEKNSLYIIATNLDTGFETWIPAQIKSEGRVVVPAKACVSLLASLSGDKIKIESKNNTVFFTTSSTSTALKGYPADEFPKLPKIKKDKVIDISHDNLEKDLSRVIIAASFSEIKPEIASIFFNIQKDKIKFAATDSFRLAEKTRQHKGSENLTLLFPARHMVEFVKIIENFNEPLTLLLSGTQAIFNSKSFSYMTRLREESFPDYEQIIPSSFSTEVKVKKSDFVNAVKLASIFSGRLREIKFNVYPEDNLFEVNTKNADIGEHVSQIPATITGERLSVTFNYSYIMEGLAYIPSAEIILRFNGDSRPVLIQDPYDASYIYLAMPMKNV